MAKKSHKKGMTFFQGVLTAATIAGIAYSITSKEDRQALFNKGKKLWKNILPADQAQSETSAGSHSAQEVLAGIAASAGRAVNEVYEKVGNKDKQNHSAAFVNNQSDDDKDEGVSSEDANR
ncbi:hypothetical protein DDV21_002090 [Streptococcus chenjunshii]|uniref:Uncharacterized protein n=1 Tax=Streptococcus chenjunshii TaxID=2173853 RepID=A0A372KNM0_9STRE|nr:hypothetical protein [Streptococcus chenjunshii]AXQ77944.1 hypothetical protein DDV21_002090 [Streptococcus chenjunshii]RFU51812.1 hypothetical protein DDV22_01680 [Streptococcus chenjunshii]RFU53900.1 hypothetical protein DDV23_02180 [Streptococcus chenjunshii]